MSVIARHSCMIQTGELPIYSRSGDYLDRTWYRSAYHSFRPTIPFYGGFTYQEAERTIKFGTAILGLFDCHEECHAIVSSPSTVDANFLHQSHLFTLYRPQGATIDTDRLSPVE